MYYVQMMVAWLLSISYIKFKEKTYQFLLSNKLDNFTFNKTISKICDSYRISKEEKQQLKYLRRK
jgi:3-methyladenine DNA glycosylase AlkD